MNFNSAASKSVHLHTIALEPLRWLPQKIFRPLPELLPAIAEAGFSTLEIFEPHAKQVGFKVLKRHLGEWNLTAPVLSSYLHILECEEETAYLETLKSAVEDGEFRAVRLFPGEKKHPDDEESVKVFCDRLGGLADDLPEIDFLLETHNNSFADEPELIVEIVKNLGKNNVGLLWQPIVFEPAAARLQFEMQSPWIRHYHLQNRDAQGKFTEIFSGVIPWEEFLTSHPADASIEFVASGIKPAEEFFLPEVLAEAQTAKKRAVELLTPLKS